MFQNILIVCVGNICRSPTAEHLLKRLLPSHSIQSAGLHALSGQDADLQAIKTALSHGVLISGHTARQLTPDMCEAADLILVMEPEHLDAVADIYPPARGKSMLFGQWLPQQSIIDPFGHNNAAFETAFIHLQAAAEAWANKLTNTSN